MIAGLILGCAPLGAVFAGDSIVLYPAYVSSGTAALEGRVIAREDTRAPAAEDSSWTNLRRNLGFLINRERENVPVIVSLADRRWDGTTDEEGYFRIELGELSLLEPGWHRINGEITGSSTETGLLVLSPTNVLGLISDLDDTILVSEVNTTRRMLGNSLLRNPLQRQAVLGTATLYRQFAARNPDPGAAPIFYLSASPRQLHFSIETFLNHNDFPPGILITKRVSNDETSEPLFDQMAYKKVRIEEILTRLPHVRFTLFGDDGERDPEIYEEVRRLHPERVDAIWIRRVNPDPGRPRLADQGDLATLLSAD